MNGVGNDNPEALKWIGLIGDSLHPPTNEQRMALRNWLAQHQKNLSAFRYYSSHVMALYDSVGFPRHENPNYKYFIVESICAQADAARIACGDRLTTPTPVQPVAASESP